MALTYRLETLGGLALVDSAGTPISTQRRRRALLALIAAAGRRGISRDKLLAYLWPESSSENARHGLEQLLYALRRQLGASTFVDVDPLRLNPQVITNDVTEFDEAFERGDLATAVSLYGGSFLDGFYLGDLGEFERWVEAERTRLAQRYAISLEQLAGQASEAGDAAAATAWWRRFVALDPLSSRATLGLMNALVAAGETAAAIRHGRAHEALARTEGAEPTPPISALLRRLLAEESQRHARAPAARSPETAPALKTPRSLRSVMKPSRRILTASVAIVAIVAIALLALGSASRATHSIVIVGTGDPATDVRAIQSAVDHGVEVALRGRFSFATAPTKPIDPLLASAWYPSAAEIRISKAVTIFGMRDVAGDMATIASGTIPFYVDAPGAHVSISGVHFVRPIQAAILVRAVRGLEISSSKIEGVVPFSNGAGGISINTRGEMPLPSSPGSPQNVSGRLLIAHNEIDATGGTALVPTAGVTVFSVGRSPDHEADVDIIGNQIRNTTAPTINVRRVQGKVRVLGNALQTSRETIGDVDAVRLVNAGSILMANNTVECSWPNAAGIQIFSPFAEWPTEHAVVEDNDVHMSPAASDALGDFSAGISIRGFAHGVVVRHNRISGRARAALSMYPFRGGVPAEGAFIDNRLDGFAAAGADIVVAGGVERARIAGPGSVADHGTATTRETSSANSQRLTSRAPGRAANR